jgi:hypothetical protein
MLFSAEETMEKGNAGRLQLISYCRLPALIRRTRSPLIYYPDIHFDMFWLIGYVVVLYEKYPGCPIRRREVQYIHT